LFAFPNKTNFRNYFRNFSEKTTYISDLNKFSEQKKKIYSNYFLNNFTEQSKFIRASKKVEGPALNGSTVTMVKELEYHISHNFAQKVILDLTGYL
jgi:hypothetical protein